MGKKGSLGNMFHRSLGAVAFGRFWQFWNLIFSYYLANKVYLPERTFLPPWFLLMGAGVLIGRWVNIDYSSQAWAVRALINSSYVGVFLGIVLTVKV